MENDQLGARMLKRGKVRGYMIIVYDEKIAIKTLLADISFKVAETQILMLYRGNIERTPVLAAHTRPWS